MLCSYLKGCCTLYYIFRWEERSEADIGPQSGSSKGEECSLQLYHYPLLAYLHGGIWMYVEKQLKRAWGVFFFLLVTLNKLSVVCLYSECDSTHEIKHGIFPLVTSCQHSECFGFWRNFDWGCLSCFRVVGWFFFFHSPEVIRHTRLSSI